MTFVVGGQTFGIETRSLGTETRNLEIQDGEDVDVLRRPDSESIGTFYSMLNFAGVTWFSGLLWASKLGL